MVNAVWELCVCQYFSSFTSFLREMLSFGGKNHGGLRVAKIWLSLFTLHTCSNLLKIQKRLIITYCFILINGERRRDKPRLTPFVENPWLQIQTI